MLGKFGMAALFVMATAAPALAAQCNDPIPPAAIDGTKATEAQLGAASHDANVFIKASDDYQECLNADLARQKMAAAAAKDPKSLDPSIVEGVDAKIAANQQMKERVGGEFHGALVAYCSRSDANPADCASVRKPAH